MGVVRRATNAGKSASAAARSAARTRHQTAWPPPRHVDAACPWRSGLAKPCHAANAAAHSAGACWWWRRKIGMTPTLLGPALRDIGGGP